MDINVRDLHSRHELVMAAKAMVVAHAEYETMLPALQDVAQGFPEVSVDHLICLWIGINEKDQEEQPCPK